MFRRYVDWFAVAPLLLVFAVLTTQVATAQERAEAERGAARTVRALGLQDSGTSESAQPSAVLGSGGIGSFDEFPEAPSDSIAISEAETTEAETEDAVAESVSEGERAGAEEGSGGFFSSPGAWFDPETGLTGSEGVGATAKTLVVMAILTLAPAVLLMTTSYARISIVLALLRQGLGAGQTPSNQIIAALSVFLTLLIMAPCWTTVYTEAIAPYSAKEITRSEAIERGQAPIREFLWKQIQRSRNEETVAVFMNYVPDAPQPEYYEDVPWRALAPAFLLSELKTAFLIGVQILLPFLIIDLVVSGVLVSAGMMMTPPALVSLPFKLALFVMVDGWTLVVKSLLESFA